MNELAAADIRRGVVRLAHRLRAERPASALSTNKVNVLGHLYRNGPTTPGAVAAAERQHPQSLTRVFAELEAAGLVIRTRSDQDRRASVLTATEAGRAALIHDMAQRDRWLTGALEQLTTTELEVLRLAAVLMDRIADTNVTA